MAELTATVHTRTSDDITIGFEEVTPSHEHPLVLTLSPIFKSNSCRYPTKVEHVMALPQSIDEYLSLLPAKTRKNIQARVKKAEEQFQIEVQKITLDSYQKWLPYYEQYIGQKPGAKIHATIERFSELEKHGSIIWIRGAEGQPVSGAVFEIFPDSLKVKWRWNNPEFLSQGSSVLLIWSLISLAIDKQIPTFRFGADTNLYGGHLSAGLRTFKLQWGTHAVAAPAAEWFWVSVAGQPRDGGFYCERQNGELEFLPFVDALTTENTIQY